MDFNLFFGRFHPIIVHLPIGFMILILLVELSFFLIKQKLNKNVLKVSWFFCFISSVFASFTGLLISSKGHYIEENLLYHKVFGFIVVGFSFISWLLTNDSIQNLFKLKTGIRLLTNSSLFIVLTITGHFGGNLTHGEDYLTEFSPINKVTHNKDFIIKANNDNLDSLALFKDLIKPIFDSKCVSCHNAEIKRGDFDMTTFESIKRGGGSGNPLNNLNPRESLLLERITLPTKNIKFMPPDGETVSYDEINLIFWWIKNLDKSDFPLSSIEFDEQTKDVLKYLYAINLEPKQWDQRLILPNLDKSLIKNLDENIFEIKFLTNQQSFISVKVLKQGLTNKELDELDLIKEHIVYFDFSNVTLKDFDFNSLNRFKNLVQLKLNYNNVQDTNILAFKELENLEVLNLIGTKITDKCFEDLSKFKNLKRVYVWNTGVSFEELNNFNSKNSNPLLIGSTF